jgi:copper chaperone CopZ
MKTIQLEVSGMSCGHCVATVRSALAGVAGVREVDVSLPARRATVKADDAVGDDALVKAVDRSGYRAVPAPTGAR